MEMYSRLRIITTADVEKLEELLETKLPTEYKCFLLSNGGGQPLNNIFRKYKGEKMIQEFSIDVLFGIDDKETAGDIFSNRAIFPDRIPSDLLTIGTDGIGNMICIGIGSDNNGKIYIWYDKERDLNEPVSYRDVKQIADDFDDFQNSLGGEDQ
jgi:hypothetical protein